MGTYRSRGQGQHMESLIAALCTVSVRSSPGYQVSNMSPINHGNLSSSKLPSCLVSLTYSTDPKNKSKGWLPSGCLDTAASAQYRHSLFLAPTPEEKHKVWLPS